jgi:penicillin-binding protein 2
VGVGQRQKYNAAKMEEFQRDHALYIAFAPADNPRVVVAAIVENAGFGAASAAPITRRVFDYLLMNQYPSEEDIAAMRKGAAAAPIGKPRDASEVAWPPGGLPLASSAPAAGSATTTLAAAPAPSAPAAPRSAPAAAQAVSRVAPGVAPGATPADAAPQGILRTSTR